MSIKYLSKEVAAKIAAGEVIERPASVVRELVDNALDARSSEITVKLESSGIKKITVIDNGTGIEKDDLAIALDNHSTSKIQTIDDLYRINTMGFRGEALYSINNVAKMTLTSSTDPTGISPGYIISYRDDFAVKPTACKQGTRVEVEEIFYNIPARRKFLKSPISELTAVKRVLYEKIFSYLDVSFSLYSDKKPVFSTCGENNFEKTFFEVFKNEPPFAIKSYQEKLDEDVTITVYYSEEDVFFNTRKYQLLFVNSRPVTVNFFYSALDGGIRNFISPGRHPLLFVYIQINPGLIDVNIHPAKREIKFYNQSDIFAMIQHCVAGLYSNALKRSLTFAVTGPASGIEGVPYREHPALGPEKERFIFDSPGVFYTSQENSAIPGMKNPPRDRELTGQDYLQSLTSEPGLYRDRVFSNSPSSPGAEPEAKLDYRILGVVFDTYIVIEFQGKVFFLDQHAVSETFIYHKKKEKYQGTMDRESFVVPVVAQLNQLDEPVLDKIGQLNALGFDIEVAEGTSIMIREVPSFLMNRKETARVVDTICDFLESPYQQDGNGIVDTLLITISCKEAVKKGDKLGMIEIAELIEIFFRHKMTHCPHGRPVFFELEKEGLDKMFQRKK